MHESTVKGLLAKLIEAWPPDRVAALATSNNPKEIEAGAFALRDALEMAMQLGRERPQPSAVSAKARRDLAEMRETVRKILRDYDAMASAANLSSAI
ncbi:hypothetical protein AB4144_08900 [Rhizobiaceae sp. 2RAB30]